MKGFFITDHIIVPLRDIRKVVPGKKNIDGKSINGSYVVVVNHSRPDDSDYEFIPVAYDEVKEDFLTALKLSEKPV